jgi:cation transport ATPase
LRPNHQKQIEEVERALEILRARKGSFDRVNDNFRRFVVPVLLLIGVVVAFGLFTGKFHFGVVLLAVLLVVVLYLSVRMSHPNDWTPADYLLRHVGIAVRTV